MLMLQNVSSEHNGSGSSQQAAPTNGTHHLLPPYRGSSGMTSSSPGRFPVSPVPSAALSGHSPSIGTHSPSSHQMLGGSAASVRSSCPPPMPQGTYGGSTRDDFGRKPGNTMFGIVDLQENNDVGVSFNSVTTIRLVLRSSMQLT